MVLYSCLGTKCWDNVNSLSQMNMAKFFQVQFYRFSKKQTNRQKQNKIQE